MRRIVLPAIILGAISIIVTGMVIGASSGANGSTPVIADRPSDHWTGTSGTTQPRIETTPVIATYQLTANGTGNWRYPGVAEDSKGNRLVIFRGPEGTKYYYAYCEKGGIWSSPKPIAGGNQPSLFRSQYAYIEVDSTDRFHCSWEDGNGAVYASFRDGNWTTPVQPSLIGRYDQTSALSVRSTDEVVTVDCEIVGLSKDLYLHAKGKDESQFRPSINLTRDFPGSTQPCVAVDSKDNLWVVWKSDYFPPESAVKPRSLENPKRGVFPSEAPRTLEDILVIYLANWDSNNNDAGVGRQLVSSNPGWSFLPQVAINSEDKVMAEWSCSTSGQYMSRLYDPATNTLGPQVSLNIGLCIKPWHFFFSRLAAHGKDFYAAAMTPGRMLLLLKFDEKTSQWSRVAQVSDRSVEMFALYSGYDNMLIAWSSWEEPLNVFLTTVSVDPYSKSRVKSVSNLRAEKRVERGFFHGYNLNALTWEVNPDNVRLEVTVSAHRVYRKGRTEDNSEWTRIAAVSGTAVKYEDRNVPSDSDYVYAVTCVDDKGKESAIY